MYYYYWAGKDPETQFRDYNLLVKRHHFIPDSAISLENKMQKRLLPQSPTSCYYKQPIQKRDSKQEKGCRSNSSVCDSTVPLLHATVHYAVPKGGAAGGQQSLQTSQHPQLCPLSQSSSSQSLQSDHSPQTPKRPGRRWGIQLTSHSEEMPWHVVAVEGEPQFHPAGHA